METNEIKTVEELNPVEENQAFDGVVETNDETEGGAGSYLIAGVVVLALTGAATIGKAAWKHAIKPGFAFIKTKLAERKSKKEEATETETEDDSDTDEE